MRRANWSWLIFQRGIPWGLWEKFHGRRWFIHICFSFWWQTHRILLLWFALWNIIPRSESLSPNFPSTKHPEPFKAFIFDDFSQSVQFSDIQGLFCAFWGPIFPLRVFWLFHSFLPVLAIFVGSSAWVSTVIFYDNDLSFRLAAVDSDRFWWSQVPFCIFPANHEHLFPSGAFDAFPPSKSPLGIHSSVLSSHCSQRVEGFQSILPSKGFENVWCLFLILKFLYPFLGLMFLCWLFFWLFFHYWVTIDWSLKLEESK